MVDVQVIVVAANTGRWRLEVLVLVTSGGRRRRHRGQDLDVIRFQGAAAARRARELRRH